MGLFDVLNGMRNGPNGQPAPSSGSSSGMSPITMAILALLAYKGMKHFGAGTSADANPADNVPVANSGGGLGDLLKGGLGGLLASGAGGGILSSGLGGLLKQFSQNGQGEVADSWVARGSNRDISENDLAKSIGSEDLDALAHNTGMSRGDLLSGLRRELPSAIDELTPDGKIPDGNDMFRRA